MTKHIVGILDYGAGNCASVRSAIGQVGFRTRLLKCAEDFQEISLLLIPGVGAFPSAMRALSDLNLIEPVRYFANQGRPVVGVCLGMQLLADASHELGYTRGLELIPGEVKPIANPRWHIGWNTLEVIQGDDVNSESDGKSFYFNHSFEFCAPQEYVYGIARAGKPIVSMVRRRNICGFQFHPEKSQWAGLRIMGNAIRGLLND